MASGARFRYSYDVEEDWLGTRKKHLPVEEASMKKLIDDEMSRRPLSRQNGPSIVARLMGMDVLPLETKSNLYPAKKREEPARTNSSNYERNLRSPPVVHRYSNSYSFEYDFDPDYEYTSSKPKRREHPQEEELQKFKKEFVAWQAATFKECSRYAETESACIEPMSHLVKVKAAERSCSRSFGEKATEIYAAERKEISPFPVRTRYRENQQAPTTIVVLRPGPDKIWSSEDSWTSFSGSSEEKGIIEDFLEEVKDRLTHELQGKILHKGPVEKPQDPQRVSKEISNRVRESVTRHLESGPGLVRSESTRSQRSDVQLNDMSSPEFISRDTRRFLTERLKNVLKRESDINIPIGVGCNFSRSCLLDVKSVSQKQDEIVITAEDREEEMHARSFQDESLSPKNLVRSLSAPVSGTSFGKLLLEDRHVVTGAHIRRKHERSIENLSAGTKKGRKEKERFSLREKVYNFRSSFTLRGRLFRKRMASMADLRTCEPSFMKDIMNGPTVILNPGERYENSTEVPPSPASVCSSTAQEEFWRPSNDLSPVSSPETTSGENYDETLAFGEITSTCNELQRQLSQSNSERAAEAAREHELGESKLPELEDGLAAYLRTLLVASGMYDGRSEPLAKPIATSIFEEVEESYKKQDKDKDVDEKGIGIDHKVLYDLLNEALSYVLGPPVISSRFGKKDSVPCALQHPHGARLMDSVWGFICPLVYPPGDISTDYSLDSMLATDLGSAPWLLQSLDKQVDAIGTDLESSILGDLIGEIVRDIKLRC